MNTLNTIEELNDYIDNSPDIAVSVRDAEGDLYLMFFGEDEIAYQGVPMETADGGMSMNNGDIEHEDGPVFPLTVLVPA